MNIRIKTYSTVTALGADTVVSGSFLYLKGFEPILVKGIKPTSVIAPVTEQLAVWTGTPTASNNLTYTISLTYYDKQTGNQETWTSVPYVADSSASATEICDNLRQQVNAMSLIIPVVATGTSTLILTATAGFAVFTPTNVITSTSTGVIAFVNGTAGIPAVGLGSDLKNGNFTDPTLVDASYYYQVIMNYNNRQNVGTSQESTTLVNKAVLYVLSTATNLSTLLGTYGTLTMAIAGKQATFSDTPAGTSPQLAYTSATGALALTGTGNTWAANDLLQRDIVYYPGAPTVYYPIQVQTSNTAGLSGAAISADVAAAAFYTIKIRPVA